MKWVYFMAEKNLPLGGTWTIAISPAPEGSVHLGHRFGELTTIEP